MFRHLSIIGFVQYAIVAIVLTATIVSSADTTPMPDAASGIAGWFSANVKPLADRKGTLDPALEAAEANPKTIKVRLDGSGEFKTITDAVKSIPSGNTQRVIVDIGPGTYKEKITIERDKPFVTFLGPPNMATIAFGGTAQEFGTVYSATLQVESEYFIAANLIIQNTAPRPDGKRPGAQALAVRIGGSKAAFYKVKMLGFQDTLCDDKGFHFFKDCYIEGTVDFIFGSGKSIYLNTEINVLTDAEPTVITAQARQGSEDTGFSFVHCSVGGTGTGALLGRAWMEAPRVVFAYTAMTGVVNPEGWSSNNHPEREAKVVFGEYKNTGPGAAPAGRVKFSKQLTEAEVAPFLSLGFIEGSKWLLPPP
ncbi:pectinesterase PPME1 [Ricinus communis]|uniref:Pectinesterase n=1 Tax=Ricinus communis TaxID=3988 RepID=B9RA17_RICCO|nr:pectinesterase PPME1 [Ricinus communis]EEF51644.1 Pectinesterase-1 precursor, putative [Ricinus communis]|eukprot:XP_002511042.1 pectinesterase PPME1 [Ricinus communis]